MTSKKFTFAPESTPLAGFTIKRGIQRGGFGEVYYAISDGGKEVALKLLHSHVEIERRGTELCLNLKHPNLVSIIDIRHDEDGDTWDFLEKEAQKVDERITLETGHKWGENHGLEEMAFGIKKLRLQCVVMNELVGSDLLVDLIQESFPDEVQSVDVASFQKM